MTSLLQEAKIISQESDQLQVTALIVSRCPEIWFSVTTTVMMMSMMVQNLCLNT